MATALRVQTVRYGGDGPELLRMLRSVTAAARQVDLATSSSELTVAIGDCGGPSGPDAVLSAQVLAEAREVLEEAGASLDYVAFKANTGHGAGQNLLARRLADRSKPARDDEVLALVNPDTYLSPDCLAKLVEALEDDTGIAEARQIPLEHPKAFDPVTGDTPWASGCLIAMRMSVFNSLGGFEPAFFLHGDDVDLSWRVRLRGLRVRLVPEAAVFHDKHMSETGFPVPSAEEELQSMLARLLLAYRAERRDLIDWWLDWIDAQGTALQRQAAAEYLRRHANRALPAIYREALGVSSDDVASVASFHEGEYAEHRF
jgi:GT2 family glycosyltransferase